MAGKAMQEKSNNSAKVLYVVSYNEEHNPSLHESGFESHR
jgi:hypothetical protein